MTQTLNVNIFIEKLSRGQSNRANKAGDVKKEVG